MTTDELIELVVCKVLERLAERQRLAVQKQREAMIAELRAFEDMHNQPHSVPTVSERKNGVVRGGAVGDIPHHGRKKQ